MSKKSHSEASADELPVVKEMTPLPKLPFFVICCVVLSESFSITMIFPFLARMVRDFGVSNEEDIGFYAGWIASSFNLAQFIAAFMWGRVSDYIGRKPVILIGLGGNVLMNFLFGWSTSLWYAILARSLNGFLNGNIGVAKTVLGEITDETNQAWGFGVFGFLWGVGMITGPLMAGFLSNAHEKAPHIIKFGSIFHRFPYLLPCIVASLIALCGFLVGLFFLKETLPNPPGCQSLEEEEYLLSQRKKSTELKEVAQSNGTDPETKKFGIWDMLTNRSILLSSITYAIVAFSTMVFDEVFAIWSTYGHEEGGINFSSTDIGYTYVINGAMLFFCQVAVFPPLAKRFGYLRTIQVASFILIFVHPPVPVLGLVPFEHKWKVWVGLAFILAVRTICLNLCFAAVMILVNNSAPPNQGGSVNGFAQTLCSGMRAAAPTVGGSLLAWSLQNGLGMPFNQYFSFFFLSCSFLLQFLLTLLLPESINYRIGNPLGKSTSDSQEEKDEILTVHLDQ